MSRLMRARRGDSGAARGTAVLVVALVIAVAAGVGIRTGYLDRWLDDARSSSPSAAMPATPTGTPAPALVADPADTAAVIPGAVRRVLGRAVAGPLLGRRVLVAVGSLDDGAPALTRGRGTAIPASTTKLVTTTAALLALGPDHVFSTDVVRTGGAGRPEIVLVGGGDPFLMRRPAPTSGPDADPRAYPRRADVVTLARRTARVLLADRVDAVTLRYDTSLFSGPAINPAWEPGYVPDGDVTPTSALWVDEGRVDGGFLRVEDPALVAARDFAAALARSGVSVRAIAPGRAGKGATPLAQVRSAPLRQIVQRIVEVSDNEASEVLLRHIGLATDGVGSTAAGRRGLRQVLAEADVVLAPGVLYDGSGLSRRNRLAPRTLVEVLRLASSPDRPELRPVVAGLPVAGFTGSLSDRMDDGPVAGRGLVRAKTGTLRGVRALAGLATDRAGGVFAFVLMADRIAEADQQPASDALDRAALALAACRCTS